MEFTCYFFFFLSEIICRDSILCGCVPEVKFWQQKHRCPVTFVKVVDFKPPIYEIQWGWVYIYSIILQIFSVNCIVVNNKLDIKCNFTLTQAKTRFSVYHCTQEYNANGKTTNFVYYLSVRDWVTLRNVVNAAWRFMLSDLRRPTDA